MSSPSPEERASDRAERGQRGAKRRTCRSPAALGPVLCYATDTVPPTRAPRAARAAAGIEPPHILAMADKTQPCGASEGAALPLLEGTTAEGRRGKEKEAVSPSTAPDAARAGRSADLERGLAEAAPRSSVRAAPQRSPPAPGSSRSPFSDRLRASSSLPLSRSGCWWRPGAPRLGGCPALFLPQPAAAPAVTSPPHPAGGGGSCCS